MQCGGFRIGVPNSFRCISTRGVFYVVGFVGSKLAQPLIQRKNGQNENLNGAEECRCYEGLAANKKSGT
jgi:hypothetical protein